MKLKTTFMYSHYETTREGSINLRSKSNFLTLKQKIFYIFDATEQGDLVSICRTSVFYHPSQYNSRCICLFFILLSKRAIRKSNKFIHLRSDIRKKHIISSITIPIKETIHSNIQYIVLSRMSMQIKKQFNWLFLHNLLNFLLYQSNLWMLTRLL